jgi:putative glutamine amidotransferase
MHHRPPVIGISTDLHEGRFRADQGYAKAVHTAGGIPLLLPCLPNLIPELLKMCDGVILTGGDDPIMEAWQQKTDARVTPVDPTRQACELAILATAQERPDLPVLGVCLGMQYMGLAHGGELDQYLPASLETAEDHWGRRGHLVSGQLGQGIVHSHHRQALTDPGTLDVVAIAPDGVIEAIARHDRSFYVGVQWHPERTEDTALGEGLFTDLIAAARSRVA